MFFVLCTLQTHFQKRTSIISDVSLAGLPGNERRPALKTGPSVVNQDQTGTQDAVSTKSCCYLNQRLLQHRNSVHKGVQGKRKFAQPRPQPGVNSAHLVSVAFQTRVEGLLELEAATRGLNLLLVEDLRWFFFFFLIGETTF